MIRKFVFVILLVLAAALTATAMAGDIRGTVADVSWEISPDGELRIYGSGSMGKNGIYTDKGTWKEFKDAIRTVRIEDGVTNIGKNAFSGCGGITSVRIPGSVTAIDSQAFMDCTGLTEVIIPEGVTAIAENAFKNCTSMTRITVPASVTKIGRNAFDGCGGTAGLNGSFTKDEFEAYLRSLSFRLIVREGSYAAEYAAREDISYEAGGEVNLNVKAREMEKADAVVSQCIRPGMSEKQKAKALHDWLVNNAYYGGDPLPLLLSGTGSCGDYAQAYSLLLTRAGIANTMVWGEAHGESHFWNLIRIDGQWYHADPTYDDPGTAARKVSGHERSSYFMRTDSQMRKDHSWDESRFSADSGFLGQAFYDPDF